MTTHVFIVDKTTFKYHLEYLFAGTGAKDYIVDFNNRDATDLNSKRENLLVSMIADAGRIRTGDYIIFYLQQSKKDKIDEGRFYGIFKAKHDWSFLDNLSYLRKDIAVLGRTYDFKYPPDSPKFEIRQNVALLKTALTASEKETLLEKFESPADREAIGSFIDRFYRDNQYLLENLEKSLTFRTLIEPYRVYAEGVTEWEALDEIKHLCRPDQMLWSLIYRKLKGNRGNTMITIYESERLCQLIADKNNHTQLDVRVKLLSLDSATQKIAVLEEPQKVYQGRQEQLNVLARLMKKLRERKAKAFEVHLQAYIVKNIGKSINASLDQAILGGKTIEWIGNEVSCGVGMQRIDLLLSVLDNDETNRSAVMPIELKSAEANEDILRQIQRYVDWLKQYYIPNRPSAIQPILVSRKIPNKESNKYRQLVESISRFNEANAGICQPLEYVEFGACNNDLFFEKVRYNTLNV
jgi:hypothetical protein